MAADEPLRDHLVEEGIEVVFTLLNIDVELLDDRVAQCKNADWLLEVRPDTCGDALEPEVSAALERQDDNLVAEGAGQEIRSGGDVSQDPWSSVDQTLY